MSEGRGESLARRTQYGVRTAVLLVAVTASCILGPMLASRYSTRIDVTATRQHALSERTLRVLEGLDDEHTIVVSADFQQLDARARQRIRDVLIELTEASGQLRTMEIDIASSSGRASFAGLLSDLAAQSSDQIEAHIAALTEVEERTRSASKGVSDAAERLRQLGGLVGPAGDGGQIIEQAALLTRLSAQLEQGAASVERARQHEVAGVALPEADIAQDSAGVWLEQTARAMDQVVEFGRETAAASEGSASDAARGLAIAAEATQTEAALAADRLRRLEPLRPLLIARVLQSQNAVLIVSPNDVQAIEFSALFPSGRRIDAAGGSEAEIRFAGEELIATALAGMTMERPPIVAFVHAEQSRLLDGQGRPTTAAQRAFRRLFDRLRLRGIDVAEWAVTFDPIRPEASALARGVGADGRTGVDRPVVWLVLSPPSSRGSQPTNQTSRLEAVNRLADAVETLIADGESFLMNLEPSDLPASGEEDPMSLGLKRLGLTVRTDAPLIRRESSPAGTLIYPFHVLRSGETGHPIGAAVNGLAIVAPWTTPIELDEGADPDVGLSPLLTIAADDDTWGEAQWMNLRAAQAAALQPILPTVPPRPDASVDATVGPWTIAAAAERPRAGGPPQRIVVFSSPTWFADQYTQVAEMVQNRRVWRFPGNLEFFEASVFWLSGLDEMIAPSAQARDIDRIRPLSDGQITAIRWMLIAGLPVLVLLIGGLQRVLRG